MSLTRREMTAGLSALAALGLAAPLMSGKAKAATLQRAGWLAPLGQNTRELGPAPLRLEGRLPDQLRGTLYRNGPGLFERQGASKGNILDGDGIVQALRFENGRVIHTSRFVQTEKLIEEESAGRFLYPTWTTKSPAGFLRNVGGQGFKTQAGITVYEVNGRLMALDEVSPPYELDPVTLETRGTVPHGMNEDTAIKAHTKIDPETGDWILVGGKFGRAMELQASIHHKDGRVTALPRFTAPRQTYLHDFFATRNYIVFSLQPAFLKLVPFLSGTRSFADSLEWNRAEGNVLVIVPKDGGAVRYLDVPGRWMWHAANAYEDRGTLVADFIGYDAPDHFLKESSAFQAIMRGELGEANEPGRIYRYVIDLADGTAREELIADAAFEFPVINPADALRQHRTVFTSRGSGNRIFHSGVAAIDTATGQTRSYEFGDMNWISEPIFAPAPGNSGGARSEEQGWLVVQGLNGETGTSFFAVLNAAHIEDGPIAIAHLEGPLPFSFHGFWQPA
ncbi:MAG: carotenoid oxygenase family protein [Parvibaculum sp.]|nr:carotenoid oxygenase family protein [Parvibaculum sp.]